MSGIPRHEMMTGKWSKRGKAGYLGVQSLLDADPPLDPGLSSLYLGHDLLDVLQLVAALPEDRWGER